jgi:hypothetical protein
MPVVVRQHAARDLAHRRSELVGEIELKRVTAGAFLDAECGVRDAGVVADHARRDLTDQVDR